MWGRNSFSPLRLYRQSRLFFSWQCNISVAQGISLVNIYLPQLNYHFCTDAVTVYMYYHFGCHVVKFNHSNSNFMPIIVWSLLSACSGIVHVFSFSSMASTSLYKQTLLQFFSFLERERFFSLTDCAFFGLAKACKFIPLAPAKAAKSALQQNVLQYSQGNSI